MRRHDSVTGMQAEDVQRFKAEEARKKAEHADAMAHLKALPTLPCWLAAMIADDCSCS